METSAYNLGVEAEGDGVLAVLIIALGALMLLGGAVCVAMGAPYLVLEHGFTLTIVGTVLASAGLILIAIGLLMRDLRRLPARLGASQGEVASQSSSGENAAALGAGLAGAGLAGAGLAGAGLAGAAVAVAQHEEGAVKAPEPDGPGQLIADQQPEQPAEAVAEAEAGLAASPPEEPPMPEEQPAAKGADVEDAEAQAGLPETSAISRDDDLGEDPEEDPFERLRRSLLEGRAQAASDAALASAPDVAEVTSQEPQSPEGAAGGGGEAEMEAADAPDPLDDAAPETAQETGPDSSPAISDEGIISVRRIGDATYTMFADGTVLAENPRGMRRFASVSDLKAHLAAGGA